MIKFTVPGEPCGKGRPRFAVTPNGVHAHTPSKTKAYEELVKWYWLQAVRTQNILFEGPVCVEIRAYFTIPERTSEKTRYRMHHGYVRPTKKPDCDNIIKVILDALNGLAYKDDAQVVLVAACKYYSEEPRVEVTICEDSGNIQ